jgi:hypothetical protein
MKRIIIIVCLSWCLFECNSPSTISYLPVFQHLGTIYGGCNQQDSTQLTKIAMTGVYQDSFHISISNDTLTCFAGIPYVCCAAFTAGFDTIQDTIKFIIKDVCYPDSVCYRCHCMCFYTFQYVFTVDSQYKHAHYAVELYSASPDTILTIAKGNY